MRRLKLDPEEIAELRHSIGTDYESKKNVKKYSRSVQVHDPLDEVRVHLECRVKIYAQPYFRQQRLLRL